MRRPNALIQFFSLLCIILGSITLSIFFITSWAHSLIFDTNYYLNIVTPLPQNPDVAKALSTYTIDTLVTNTNIEDRISNALPEKAKFLSPTLADNLKSKSYQLTTTIIQSDQFQSIWVAANTLFHKRVLNIVRSGGLVSELENKQILENTRFQFDGSQLIAFIKDQLGKEGELITDEQIQKFQSLMLPTAVKLQTIRKIVYWISQLSAMLLPVSLALILYGVAISFSRPKAFLVAGIFIAIAMLLTLVTLQIVKTDVLNHVTQPVYNSAANVIWNNFVKGLKQSLRLSLLEGLILVLLASIFAPYQWAQNVRKTLGLTSISKSRFVTGFMKFRVSLSHFALLLYLLGVLIAATVLLTTGTLTVATVVMILSLLILYFALLSFLFPRQKNMVT